MIIMIKSKLLKVLLTFAFLFIIIGLPVSSYGRDKEEGLYIRTESVPLEVEEFAKDLFLSTTYKDIDYLGIDAPLENLTLSKGVKGTFINNNSKEKYYFFVLDGDRIVAHIHVVKDGNRLGGSYSSGIFESLNNVKTTPDNPISILVSKSFYYLDNSGLHTISNSFYANEDTIKSDIETVNSSPSLYSQNEESMSVLICQNNVYDIKLDNNINDSRVVVGLSLDNFPCVPNKSINGGICWASSTGAII